MRRRLGPSGIDAVLEAADDGGVPDGVEIFRARIHRHTVAALVGVSRGVERLMDIADEVDQEGQIAVGAEAVVTAVFEASGIFVDFAGDAVSRRGIARGCPLGDPECRG